MTWLIRLPDGSQASSDDLTLDDLEAIERESGAPWSTAAPLNSVPAARAHLRAAYRRAGLDPDRGGTLTLRTIKATFEHVPDVPWPGDDGAQDADPLDRSSPGSSPGPSAGSGGPHPSPGSSG